MKKIYILVESSVEANHVESTRIIKAFNLESDAEEAKNKLKCGDWSHFDIEEIELE